MKHTLITTGLMALTLSLGACGGDDHTTVVHDRPVIVNTPASSSTPSSVESNCRHGYDNDTHSCY